MKEVKLADCGLSYAVVSIMGPQSSGMLSCFHSFIVFPSLLEIIEFYDCCNLSIRPRILKSAGN